MDHTLSRAEGQRVRYVREWRSVEVHQPSASSLRMLAGALLLMSLALGVLALVRRRGDCRSWCLAHRRGPPVGGCAARPAS